MAMDDREILTRFKDGSLDRGHALALLGGARDTAAVPLATVARAVGPPEPAAGWCAVVGLRGVWPGADDPDAFWAAALREHVAEDDFNNVDTDVDVDVAVDMEELSLACARQVLESAGYAGARLDALTGPDGEGRGVGVFAGVGAARLSTALDLRGPSQDIGTASSSFLTALHLALGALRAGECAAALVLTGESAGRMTALLLKPLAAARAAGDVVHAVVPAAAVGHPGRGAPLILRERLRSRVLRAAGTRAALLEEDGYDAGTAVIRAVLQLRYATLLPGPGQPRPAVWTVRDPEESRTAVVGVYEPDVQQAVVVLREADRPLMDDTAADEVGDGEGHLVLLSAATPAHLTATAARFATWIADHDRIGPGLAAVARELRLGRAAADCRLALVAYSTSQLAAGLAEFATSGGTGSPDLPPVHTADLRDSPAEPLLLGALPETRAYLDALWEARRFEQLIRLWLAGVDVLGAARARLGGPVTELPPGATSWSRGDDRGART